MKKTLTILTLLFTLYHVRAQVVSNKADSLHQVLDSTRHAKRAKVVSINEKTTRVTTKVQAISNAPQQKIDSLKLKLNGGRKIEKIDSATSNVTGIPTAFTQKGKQYTDSMGVTIEKYNGALRKNKLTSKADSLKGAGFGSDKYSRKLDSLNGADPSQKILTGVNERGSKIQSLQDVPSKGINEKLSLLSKESGGQGNLPQDVNLPKTDLPVNKIGLPGGDKLSNSNLTGTSVNTNLSGSVPDGKLPDNPINENNNPTPGVPDVNVPDTNLPNTKILTGKELKSLDKIKTGTNDLSEVSDKASGYKEKISADEIDPKEIESLEQEGLAKLPDTKGQAVIREHEQFVKTQQAQIKSYKNPAAYKEQTLAKGKSMVAKQMLLQKGLLQESIGKVSKYQKQMGTILSKTSDLPKKRDPLRKLKTYEKFVPGITLQIQKPGAWLVDFNPSLAYRLTSYWLAGAGWNERVVFGEHTLPDDLVRIYGVRSFTEVIVFKGFSVRLDAENMHAFMIPIPPSQDISQKISVWNYGAGIKKDFSFVPRVNGNVQFMYKVYSSHTYNVYPARFNIRFGFEYSLLKKHKRKSLNK